jgi:hypothetical protein
LAPASARLPQAIRAGKISPKKGLKNVAPNPCTRIPLRNRQESQPDRFFQVFQMMFIRTIGRKLDLIEKNEKKGYFGLVLSYLVEPHLKQFVVIIV